MITKKKISKAKLIPEVNPDLLEENCAQVQVLSQGTKSDSQKSHSPQLKYSVFSLPNSKVKFLRGTRWHTLVIPSKKKWETNFDSPFSVSSEKYEPFEKTEVMEEKLQMEPLETDLNTIFHINEKMKDELKVDKKCSVCPSSIQPTKILDLLKTFVADGRLVFGWCFPADYESLKIFMIFLHVVIWRLFSCKAEGLKILMLVPQLCNTWSSLVASLFLVSPVLPFWCFQCASSHLNWGFVLNN